MDDAHKYAATSPVGKAAAVGFMRAYKAAPPEADIEFHMGESTAGEREQVIIAIVEGQHFAFNARECETMAEIVEETISRFGVVTRQGGLPDLALSFRHAASRLSNA